MTNQSLDVPETEQDIHKRETLNGKTSVEALQLRAISARRTEKTLRDTIRIPRTDFELARMPEDDFKQYILGMTDAAAALIMNVLELMANNSDKVFYQNEFEQELTIDGKLNAAATIQFVSIRIKHITALKRIFEEAKKPLDTDSLDQAKALLEELEEKLQQWRSVR